MVIGEESNIISAVEPKLISQKSYPTFECLDRMPQLLNSIENETVRHILSITLGSGFRVVEALNSFVYIDEEGRMVIQGPMEKMYHQTKHKSPKRGFWGVQYLNYRVGNDDKLWKSVRMLNPFKLDMDWLHDYVSDSPLEPKWLFKGTNYFGEYNNLKKMPEFEVFYFRSRHLLPVKMMMVPGFHYYRKTFVAGAIYKKLFKENLDIVNYMHWGNPAMILAYFKLYAERDVSAANEMINDMKSVSTIKWRRG
jgi:hypothetical protein